MCQFNNFLPHPLLCYAALNLAWNSITGTLPTELCCLECLSAKFRYCHELSVHLCCNSGTGSVIMLDRAVVFVERVNLPGAGAVSLIDV